MAKLIIYSLGKHNIFRGKSDPNMWYVYDTHADTYVGGSFTSKAAALKYAEGRE